MRTLIHLSDLHFGRVDEALLDPLIAAANEIKPDLVVVSGDLTQRARSDQFKAARRFIDRLPGEKLIVPGNHDVPLWNVFARVMTPLSKFRKHVTDDLSPMFVDDEIAVVGINTARSMVVKSGRINHAQINEVHDKLCALHDHMTKIIVTHHPFDLPEDRDDVHLVGRAKLAMKTFAACGADVLLAGHFHTSHAGSTLERYRIVGHAALVIQAGTATSTRGRGETNSFNVLRIQHPGIALQRYDWDVLTRRFQPAAIDFFESAGGEWVRKFTAASEARR